MHKIEQYATHTTQVPFLLFRNPPRLRRRQLNMELLGFLGLGAENHQVRVALFNLPAVAMLQEQAKTGCVGESLHCEIRLITEVSKGETSVRVKNSYDECRTGY